MDIIQYFEDIRQAYIDEDTERMHEIIDEHGNRTITMREVESLVSYVFSTMAGFQVAMEERSQVQFDMIVNALEEHELLTEVQADNLRQLDAQLSNAIGESLAEEEEE